MNGRPITRATIAPPGKLAKSLLHDETFAANLVAYAAQTSAFLETIAPLYAQRDDYDINLPFDTIIAMLAGLRWAYPIKTRTARTAKVDRTRPMLIGPLFTSADHPWPQHEGKFREPLCQFDLEEVGALQGVDLGSGMLQLWLGPEFDDYHIRIVPKSAVTRANLTPLPPEICPSYFEGTAFFAADWDSWLNHEDGGDTTLIAGTKKKILTWPSYLDDALCDLLYNIDEAHKPPVEDFLKCLGFRAPRTAPHYFGNFNAIQYNVEEMPPCLLSLESNGPFIWGDCGNAQIFYSRTADGTLHFSFAWSCT